MDNATAPEPTDSGDTDAAESAEDTSTTTTAPAAPAGEKKWYIVHTYSGHENKAKLTLLERVRNANLTEYFGDVLVPTESVMEVVKGQRRTTTRKFFPGYMFVQMELDDARRSTWSRTRPKITGLPRRQQADAGARARDRRRSDEHDRGQGPAEGPRRVRSVGDHVRVKRARSPTSPARSRKSKPRQAEGEDVASRSSVAPTPVERRLRRGRDINAPRACRLYRRVPRRISHEEGHRDRQAAVQGRRGQPCTAHRSRARARRASTSWSSCKQFNARTAKDKGT